MSNQQELKVVKVALPLVPDAQGLAFSKWLDSLEIWKGRRFCQTRLDVDSQISNMRFLR
jgi:hypothetical protein